MESQCAQCRTCVGSASQWQREAAAESHSLAVREDTASLTHSLTSSPLFLSTVTGYLVQPYQPLSLCLYLSLQISLLLLLPSLSLIVSPHITPLSLSLSSCCFSLSPPPPPLFSPFLSLYGKAVNSLTPLPHCPPLLSSPSIFLSLVFQWLCKLSNLIADKVINTILASLNTQHSALCIFLPLYFRALHQTWEVWAAE